MDDAQADRDSALVKAMVTMGASLDLEVVAEGIEDPGQLEALAGLGCPLGQGYLFSRPVSAEDIGAMVQLSLEPSLVP